MSNTAAAGLLGNGLKQHQVGVTEFSGSHIWSFEFEVQPHHLCSYCNQTPVLLLATPVLRLFTIDLCKGRRGGGSKVKVKIVVVNWILAAFRYFRMLTPE